jgi:ABC-type multidrug transport system fused ATPase/permease subunit
VQQSLITISLECQSNLISPSISNCAASICIFRDGFIKGYTRLLLMAIWAVLFIAYTSVFTTRLQKWNDNVSSHCYKTTIIARSNASHPYVDNIYIAVTCMFIALSFIYSLVLSLNSKLGQLQNALSKIVSSSEIAQAILEGYRLGLSYNPTIATLGTDLQFSILSIAMWQCPLHIYSIFALRASNERYLEQGSSEKEWGFGQIAAMALLGGNVLQFVDGVIGMFLSGLLFKK